MPEPISKPKKKQSETLRDIWPDLREMILPRRGLLALSLLLMVITLSIMKRVEVGRTSPLTRLITISRRLDSA